MSLISPVGAALFGGKKSASTLAGAALGGIPGAVMGSQVGKSKPQTATGS